VHKELSDERMSLVSTQSGKVILGQKFRGA